MKNKLWILFLLALSQRAYSQLIPDENILLIQDSLIYPVYNYEYIPDVTYAQMEDRILSFEKTIPLHFNNRVKSFIDYFTITDRDYTKMVLGKMNLYFPIFEEKLREYGLPDELKYLSVVESGLNPKAKSRAGAVGLWQFVRGTAHLYGLRMDWYVDERMDPEKSTEAACRLLVELYDEFNDWELAMAAYNCGPGNVRKAIRRSGYKKKFWDIYRYLPRETRSYVPQFVAINYVANNTEAHNFYKDDYAKHFPETDTLIVNQFLYIKTLADLTGICREDIEMLNPDLKRRAIPGNVSPYILKVPSDVKELINTNRQYFLDSARNTTREELDFIARNETGSTYGREKIVHIVRSGEVLGTIAAHYKVNVEDIKAWNDLYSNLIRVNQRLNIWVTEKFYETPVNTQVPVITVKPQDLAEGNYYIVQPGDSLWKIIQQYQGLTIEMLKKLNHLESNKIMPGQKLKIS